MTSRLFSSSGTDAPRRHLRRGPRFSAAVCVLAVLLAGWLPVPAQAGRGGPGVVVSGGMNGGYSGIGMTATGGPTVSAAPLAGGGHRPAMAGGQVSPYVGARPGLGGAARGNVVVTGPARPVGATTVVGPARPLTAVIPNSLPSPGIRPGASPAYPARLPQRPFIATTAPSVPPQTRAAGGAAGRLPSSQSLRATGPGGPEFARPGVNAPSRMAAATGVAPARTFYPGDAGAARGTRRGDAVDAFNNLRGSRRAHGGNGLQFTSVQLYTPGAACDGLSAFNPYLPGSFYPSHGYQSSPPYYQGNRFYGSNYGGDCGIGFNPYLNTLGAPLYAGYSYPVFYYGAGVGSYPAASFQATGPDTVAQTPLPTDGAEPPAQTADPSSRPPAPPARRGDGTAAENARRDPREPNSLVEAVQDELARRGYYAGQLDGVFRPDTQQALRLFQKNHELAPTGRINEATLFALGLN